MILKKLIHIIFLTLITTGCTQHFFEGFNPQSNFDYPNSNVKPLGNVKGEASETKIFSMPFVTGNLQEEAISKALAKKPGADILINYASSVDQTDIFIFHTVTYKVEGTAAKMVIGKQILLEQKQ